MKNATGTRFPPPLIPLSAVALGALLKRFNPAWWPEGTPWMIAGGALFFSGAAFAAWAMLLMRARRTTPSPFGAASALLEEGPYRFSRNPIYLAALVLQAGAACAFALPAALLPLPLEVWLFNRCVIRHEERYLREHFAEPYAAYAARVRRWI